MARISNLNFEFDPDEGEHGAFIISSNTTSAITKLYISNYGVNHNLEDMYNTTIILFGGEGTTETKIIYPTPTP